MVFYFVVVFLIALIGIRTSKFNDDYLSIKQTTSINGIFVLLVFARHFNQYITLSDTFLDNSFVFINTCLGQLIVTTFFFFSGYGIFYSIKNKSGYMKGFILHRFLPTFIQFSICVGLFLVVAIIMGEGTIKYSTKTILLSFTGWEGVGNSNWFMFVTFSLYILLFLSFRFLKNNQTLVGLIIFSVLSFGLVVLLFFTKKDSWWWNTLLCFPLGMWYCYFKDKIDSVMKNKKYYWPVLSVLVVTVLGLLVVQIKFGFGIYYIGLACLFPLLIVVVTMKLRIGNQILLFFGIHTFSFYIFQRMPMIFLQKLSDNRYLYLIMCFAITVVFALLFDIIVSKSRAFIIKSFCRIKAEKNLKQ